MKLGEVFHPQQKFLSHTLTYNLNIHVKSKTVGVLMDVCSNFQDYQWLRDVCT